MKGFGLAFSVFICLLSTGKLIKISLSGFKGSIFRKNRHFNIQERFNKLIYGFNLIIKCGN